MHSALPSLQPSGLRHLFGLLPLGDLGVKFPPPLQSQLLWGPGSEAAAEGLLLRCRAEKEPSCGRRDLVASCWRLGDLLPALLEAARRVAPQGGNKNGRSLLMAAVPALLPMQGIPRPAHNAHAPVPLHHDASSRLGQPCREPPDNGGICAAGCMRLGPVLGGALGSPRSGDKWAAPARVWDGEVKTRRGRRQTSLLP